MAQEKLTGIKACVFDAYGTLFDVNAAAAHCADDLGDKWQPLAELWRAKQLQYTWLRALQKDYADFWQVTGDALDFSMASLDIDDTALRSRLMDLYMALDAYPEVATVLEQLQAKGIKTAILSNGSPDMLASAVENAGIADHLDAVMSVHDFKTFKTAPVVYEMPLKEFSISADEVSFQSSNAWDAHAGSAFGYKVCWINRFGQARERLPGDPDIELATLSPLPDIVER